MIEHTSRMEWPEGFEAPRACLAVEDVAVNNGWGVQLTYARGGEPLMHSVAVRVKQARQEGLGWLRGGYICYIAKVTEGDLKWTADTCMVWGSDHWPVSVGLGVTEFKRYLKEGSSWDGKQVAAWAQGLRVKVARQKAMAKERVKLAPKKAKVI